MSNRPTKVPGLPTVPAGISPELRQYLSNLAEAVEIRLGRRGDPIDRAVTLRELVDSGLATYLRGAPYDPLGAAPPDFESNVPEIGDQPTVPTGFEANGAYSVIILEWDVPFYYGHATTEIWRFDEDILGDASLVGVATGNVHIDYIGGNQSAYYWIRHVNRADIKGPFTGPAGEFAETAPDVAVLLETLSDSITESQLFEDLGARIDLVDGPAALAGSVANQIAAEAEARASAITAAVGVLQGQLNDLAGVAEYDPTRTYLVDELTIYDGSLYRAVAETTDNLPTDTNFWLLLGDYSSLGTAVGQNASSIVELNTISATSTSANAQALFALSSEVGDQTTGLSATATAVDVLETTVNHDVTGLVATASRVSALEISVNDETAGVEATATAVDGVIATVSNEVTGLSATVDRVLALEATVDDETSGLEATATAVDALETTVNSETTGLVATVDRVLALEATVDDETAGVEATATALEGLTTIVSSDVTGLVATATRVSALETKVNNETTGVVATADAVDALETTVNSETTGLVATVDRVLALEATVDDETTGVEATATALQGLTTIVSNEATGLVATNSVATAAASAVTQLSTTVGGNTTTISTQATSINGLRAQYTVKIDSNNYVTGFGLASTSVNGAPFSEFIVRADRFAIASSSQEEIIPFVVTTAESVLNGITVPAGVYMDQAYIKNGAITNVKIGNAAVDDAKIASLSAGKITTGTLDANSVTIAGVSPTFSIKSASSGQRLEMNATNIRAYDYLGNLRVVLGDLTNTP